jgi:hypothetical protein
MMLALGDRQAVEMRPQAALEQRRAIDDEMMRRDRASDAGAMAANDIDSFLVLTRSATTFRPGCSRSSGTSVRSMNTALRPKISTAGSVMSPWIRSGMPIRSMRSSIGRITAIQVTP